MLARVLGDQPRVPADGHRTLDEGGREPPYPGNLPFTDVDGEVVETNPDSEITIDEDEPDVTGGIDRRTRVNPVVLKVASGLSVFDSEGARRDAERALGDLQVDSLHTLLEEGFPRLAEGTEYYSMDSSFSVSVSYSPSSFGPVRGAPPS